MELAKELSRIQSDLKAPKLQKNTFGKYSYRSCEDILESVKPLLSGLFLTMVDEVVMVGDRYYVKSTVTISDGGDSYSVSALARECENKKGMDQSQITGAASSYARKYALSGLFCIDDNRDSDATNNNSGKSRSKNWRAGNNPDLLPDKLRAVYSNIREALELGDMQAVSEMFCEFALQEEMISVWNCFASNERASIQSYTKSSDYIAPENIQKVEHLNGDELEEFLRRDRHD